MKPVLFLPAVCAIYQNWTYYEVIISVEELVKNFPNNGLNDFRIKTTDEVEIIYTQRGLNNLLQRAYDDNRLEPITRFINTQPDAYINNLTVAIYGGNPEWIPIQVRRSSLNEDIDDLTFNNIENTYGLIKLSGSETLFVLDGQHRLKSLRKAFLENDRIGGHQIALTIITHIDDINGKQRTRRLFSTINRHAKPVSLGENILLDEDDLSAILVRDLIETYELFLGQDLIALNKTADIKLPRDSNKFTTVISLYNVNEKIIDQRDVYPRYIGAKKNLVRIRPEENIILRYKEKIHEFWNIFFDCFPNASAFCSNVNINARDNGGPLSLRPIGQKLFVEFYLKMESLNRLNDVQIIQIIPDNIADQFWHYILYDPIGNTISGKLPFIRNYMFYHLNLTLTQKELRSLLISYRKALQDETLELPTKLILMND